MWGLSWHDWSHDQLSSVLENNHMKRGRTMQMEVKRQWEGGHFQSSTTAPMFVLRDKTMLAVAVGIKSYLCQMGIDPFCKCPLLHRLLLICKAEPSASASLTYKSKQWGFKQHPFIDQCRLSWVKVQTWVLTRTSFHYFLLIVSPNKSSR